MARNKGLCTSWRRCRSRVEHLAVWWPRCFNHIWVGSSGKGSAFKSSGAYLKHSSEGLYFLFYVYNSIITISSVFGAWNMENEAHLEKVTRSFFLFSQAIGPASKRWLWALGFAGSKSEGVTPQGTGGYFSSNAACTSKGLRPRDMSVQPATVRRL